MIATVDVHLYEFFFRWSLYSADNKMLSTFVQVVQKWLGTNDILRNKSHSDIKFAKLSLGLLCTLGTVVVHLYFGF